MAMLFNYGVDDYGRLIAADKLDASKGALFGATSLDPDTANRTILIGLGGTGVQTIDYVKGAISKRLNANWPQYIAFLGIDTDSKEFSHASYLTAAETINITRPGVEGRMSDPNSYPSAVTKFIPPDVRLAALNGDGAGKTRLAGKVKIHDQEPGKMGVDQEIIGKLRWIKAHNLAPLPGAGNSNYEVYVIGSCFGGTCSGGLLELPAMIRTAIPQNVKVHLIVYLPDLFDTVSPEDAPHSDANAVGTLKELNYFLGMHMRPDNSESWANNDPASPEIRLQSSIAVENYVDIPYLVGTLSGDNGHSFDEAKDTVAEFLISLLAKITVAAGKPHLTASFLNNALAAAKVSFRLYKPGNPEQEAVGEHHEFPRRYASIGYSKATFPKKLVRSYTVAEACKKAGFVPVDKTTRDNLLAAGEGVIVPFAGKHDLLTATEGTAIAKQLLKPIENIHGIINAAQFSITQDLGQTVDWNSIKNMQFDTKIISDNAGRIVENRSAGETIDQMRNAIKKAFAEFRINVREYVRAQGPYAFVNLYKGIFTKVGDDYGVGLAKMIQNLVDGKNLDGRPAFFLSEDVAAQNLSAARNVIDTTRFLLGIDVSDKKNSQAAAWINSFDNYYRAKIITARRNIAYGVNGELNKFFRTPAEVLANQVAGLGVLLESLAGAYTNLGKNLEEFTDFSNAKENFAEVNLAAVSVQSHAWLKKQAEVAVAAANGKAIRNKLIDDFFAIEDGVPNAEKWLEVPDHYVTKKHGQVVLTVPDRAIPARQLFDSFMSEEFPDELAVSIEGMFEHLQSVGQSFDQTAEEIISQLRDNSRPLINGNLPDNCMNRYIMYPNSLNTSTGNGPAIAAAIQNAAATAFGLNSVQAFASDDADGIMFYQIAAPFELYRLNQLKVWNQNYEDGAFGIHAPAAYLHGMSPDVKSSYDPYTGTSYTERTPWKDYPPVVGFDRDPRLPDPLNGQISREGKIRLALDEMIVRAKKAGVLYTEQTKGGYIVKRVNCNEATDWRFEVGACIPNEIGLLPLGKEFTESLASQNGKTLKDISAIVKLAAGGVYDMPHSTEALAWEYAAKALRFHMPMQIEVRNTLEKLEGYVTQINEYNERILRQFEPAKFAWMLKAQLIRTSGSGLWTYVDPNGTVKPIANLTAQMKAFLLPKDKKLIDNGLLAYYLFSKIEAALPVNRDSFDAALERSRGVIGGWAVDEDLDALQAGETVFQSLYAEVEALREKGAKLDGSEAEPRGKFKAALPGFTVEELKKIDTFYFRFSLWENI